MAGEAANPNNIPVVNFDAILPHIGEMGPYQLGLFLLMCIPATLPAAFLAFNQVFLSAEPDHWCRIPELETFQASGNLDPGLAKKLSIPRVNLGKGREHYVLYKRCTQYDVNFTAVLEANGGEWPKKPDPDWPQARCKSGWLYDRSEYQNTLVTEVRKS